MDHGYSIRRRGGIKQQPNDKIVLFGEMGGVAAYACDSRHWVGYAIASVVV